MCEGELVGSFASSMCLWRKETSGETLAGWLRLVLIVKSFFTSFYQYFFQVLEAIVCLLPYFSRCILNSGFE